MLTRARAIEEIAGKHFEVVVIGGGITGAGVALDAASRGYSVALLERGDYALGTSSRSSKMVHGGLRYLQNFDLGLVREALLERQLMVRLAPHLVYPTPFLVAALGEERRDRKLGLGLNMYDVMATTRAGRSRRERRAREEAEDSYWSPDRHRTIDQDEVLDLVPALAPREPHDAYLFYDCQTDDVRLVLTVLGEAERFGAVMLNGAEVTEVLSANGKANGVAFVEEESGERMEVGADHVVNATGVFADQIRPEELLGEEDVPRISPSRGTHILLDEKDLPMGKAACIVPAGEGRMIGTSASSCSSSGRIRSAHTPVAFTTAWARIGKASPLSASRTWAPRARPSASSSEVTSSPLANTAPKRSASPSTVSTRRTSSVWQS